MDEQIQLRNIKMKQQIFKAQTNRSAYQTTILWRKKTNHKGGHRPWEPLLLYTTTKLHHLEPTTSQ